MLVSIEKLNGELGLVDRVLALHAGSRGFDSHRGHMSERFFRSSRLGYPHPVSSELENSGIRVAVGDCSVTERRRWRPPYQTGKTVHVHAKHYKHKGAGCVRQWIRTAEPLGERRYENWNTHTLRSFVKVNILHVYHSQVKRVRLNMSKAILHETLEVEILFVIMLKHIFRDGSKHLEFV